MKSIIISISLFCVFGICKAQTLPELPTINSNTSRSKIQSYIQQYLDNPAPDGRPSSYIINTNDLFTYFNQLQPDQPIYFHVYFGIDATGTIQLVIIPTIQEILLVNGGPALMHDPNPDWQVAFVPCINSNMTSSFFYVPDNFDPSSVAVSATTTSVSANCPLILKATASAWITQYQNIYSNALSNYYIQSFSFNAEKLRSFLLNNPNSVPYLQIYLGVNQDLDANLNQEDYTLIFMGLDANGNHIPVDAPVAAGVLGNRPMAFEACRPCPVCGIAVDNGFDNYPQITGSVLKESKMLLKSDTYKNALESYLESLKISPTEHPIVRKVRKQKHTKIARVKRLQNKHSRKHKRYNRRVTRHYKKYNRQYIMKQ